jgi:hypothetical protein
VGAVKVVRRYNHGALVLLSFICLHAHQLRESEVPYNFFDWEITYGDINRLGAPQQGILIK